MGARNKVLKQVAPTLFGLALLLHSSPIMVFLRVDPPANLPTSLAAGELFILNKGNFDDWRVDGRPLTALNQNQLLGATSLKSTFAELTAWKWDKESEFNYFQVEVPLTYKPHQTRHKALRIPATTWSRVQSKESKDLRARQRKHFGEIIRSSPEEGASLCLSAPLHSKVTSKFGRARELPNGEMYHHTGTDYAARTGTPIFPSAEGIVALSDDFVVSGGFVALYHGFNLTTTYAHLSRRDVQVGDRLAPNQSLGLSGATGRVTGPHLHWELFWRDRPVDPFLALETLQDLCDPE